MSNITRLNAAAYGGDNWKPRRDTHLEEIGRIWAACGVNSEWSALRKVLLHPPGDELINAPDPNSLQLLDLPSIKIAKDQHNAIVQAYRDADIQVNFVEPSEEPSANLIFCADLFFMTPQGAILSRPASTVRAGEEIWVARRLADLGIPILKTLTKKATFEGADALWVNPKQVLIGRGLRTNDEGISQISSLLTEMDVEVIPVDLPVGTMHLMGILRFLDKDLVITWPYRIGWKAVETLKSSGYKILYIPDEVESTSEGALNFVTLGPKSILMADGNPNTQSFLESQGVTCKTIRVDELLKAAGGIGCLTGIIEREIVHAK
jgi:arginine deiminase